MNDDQMLQERRETWHLFTKLMFYSVVVVVVVLVLMGAFLTPWLSGSG